MWAERSMSDELKTQKNRGGQAMARGYGGRLRLRAGRLQDGLYGRQVLGDHPPTSTPLSALYPPNRQLALRVRVFLDWIAGLFPKTSI